MIARTEKTRDETSELENFPSARAKSGRWFFFLFQTNTVGFCICADVAGTVAGGTRGKTRSRRVQTPLGRATRLSTPRHRNNITILIILLLLLLFSDEGRRFVPTRINGRGRVVMSARPSRVNYCWLRRRRWTGSV